jgi:hypothetical protein
MTSTETTATRYVGTHHCTQVRTGTLGLLAKP